MNRLALGLTVFCLSSLAALNLVEISPADHHPASSVVNEDYHEEYVNYYCFKNILDASIVKLHRKEMKLKEACIQIEAAARRWHPKYLRYIQHSELGESHRERIMQNLIGHIRVAENITAGCSERVEALETEYREIPPTFFVGDSISR